MKKQQKYNFVQLKNGKLNKFYDKENVVSLYIFESGWKDFFHCILEWGEYQQTEHLIYNLNQIDKFYGVKAFIRKEKLLRINKKIDGQSSM